jgi:hypothetical protein
VTDSPDLWNWPESLDALQAAPDHHEVVLEACIAPGDTVPMQTHRWPSMLHVLSSSDFMRRDADGTVVRDSRGGNPVPAGGSVLSGARLAPHSPTNVGTHQLRVIAVEIKR